MLHSWVDSSESHFLDVDDFSLKAVIFTNELESGVYEEVVDQVYDFNLLLSQRNLDVQTIEDTCGITKVKRMLPVKLHFLLKINHI